MDIRLARNEDGEEIHTLLVGMGFMVEGLDWSDIHPHWIVVEDDGWIVGCLQIILSKPVGWLELMGLDQSLSHSQRAKAVKALLEFGIAGLAKFGASAVMGAVPFDLKTYKRLLKKRGGVVTGSGNLIALRLR